MTHKFATGHTTSGSTTAVTPQPKCEGIDEGRRIIDGSGGLVIDGYPSLTWDYTVLTEDELDTLLSAFGLSSASSALCTIVTHANDDRDEITYEATVYRPDMANKFRMGYWRDIAFEFKRLVVTT